jgi:thiosulfate/3-mercaptopyruvate sulfurtransferase
MNHRLFLAVFMFLMTLSSQGFVSAELATPVASPSGSDYAHPDWLAESVWLEANLNDTDLALIALMPPDDFANAHIAGSVQADWPEFEITETGDQQVLSWQKEVEAIFTELGVTREQTVVVYDGGSFYAARLWWLFHLLGHDDVRILNGGLEGWQAQGYSVETGPSKPIAANQPYVGKPDDGAIATLAEVEAAVASNSSEFIDARTADEYTSGHIPGAVNIPFTENAVADGPKYWKSAAELDALYSSAGITRDASVIPYCSTGVRSAATYFTLGLIGYTDVQLFTGSFKEWSADPSRPVTTGDKP